jgi:hypothetical protein
LSFSRPSLVGAARKPFSINSSAPVFNPPVQRAARAAFIKRGDARQPLRCRRVARLALERFAEQVDRVVAGRIAELLSESGLETVVEIFARTREQRWRVEPVQPAVSAESPAGSLGAGIEAMSLARLVGVIALGRLDWRPITASARRVFRSRASNNARESGNTQRGNCLGLRWRISQSLPGIAGTRTGFAAASAASLGARRDRMLAEQRIAGRHESIAGSKALLAILGHGLIDERLQPFQRLPADPAPGP